MGNEKGVHLKSKVRVAQGDVTGFKLFVSLQTVVAGLSYNNNRIKAS